MEIHFNYNEDIVNHYLPLLLSPDSDVRSTAIVDIIMQKVYSEYPFEFTELMRCFKSHPDSYVPDSGRRYNELYRALFSYESISGLKLRENIDSLMTIVNVNNPNNAIQVINERLEEISFKLIACEDTISHLNSKIIHLENRANQIEYEAGRH
jgi:hypothetical protein